mmetsp:Transcript_24346/g.53164  ORF Transcript_24346/g.53164 Transcript_24346/m.53164 type:complete len:252 (+) Transcript_24346:233-988(+)
MTWGMDLGPLHVGGDGLALRPQFMVRGEVANFSIGAGLGDVRNGIKLSAEAQAEQKFYSEADSFREFLMNLKAKDGVADDLINPLIKYAGAIVAEVARLIHVDIRYGHVAGFMALNMGLGISASAALGWKDVEGYNMVGAGGSVSTLLKLGASVFAGKKDWTDVKVIVGLSNYGLNFRVKFPKKIESEESMIKLQKANGLRPSSLAEQTEPPAGDTDSATSASLPSVQEKPGDSLPSSAPATNPSSQAGKA